MTADKPYQSRESMWMSDCDRIYLVDPDWWYSGRERMVMDITAKQISVWKSKDSSCDGRDSMMH